MTMTASTANAIETINALNSIFYVPTIEIGKIDMVFEKFGKTYVLMDDATIKITAWGEVKICQSCYWIDGEDDYGHLVAGMGRMERVYMDTRANKDIDLDAYMTAWSKKSIDKIEYTDIYEDKHHVASFDTASVTSVCYKHMLLEAVAEEAAEEAEAVENVEEAASNEETVETKIELGTYNNATSYVIDHSVTTADPVTATPITADLYKLLDDNTNYTVNATHQFELDGTLYAVNISANDSEEIGGGQMVISSHYCYRYDAEAELTRECKLFTILDDNEESDGVYGLYDHDRHGIAIFELSFGYLHGGPRNGSGRKATGRKDSVSVSCKISEADHAALKERAQEQGLTVSGYAKKIILESL